MNDKENMKAPGGGGPDARKLGHDLNNKLAPLATVLPQLQEQPLNSHGQWLLAVA
ncbi:MAG: hypothetical protein HY674_10340 [Chloroflexi bacterium]|nr:hypothetical protein [Chloroflexota bacterium]